MKIGIIVLEDKNLIQILKIIPINYCFKSEFEKKTILDSYKTFFQTINFDIQILIMSEKEDYSYLNDEISSSNNEILKNNYINFVNSLNNERDISKKIFYMIIKEEYSEKNIQKSIENLNEKFNSIKNLLSKCGNQVLKIENNVEVEKIFQNYLIST